MYVRKYVHVWCLYICVFLFIFPFFVFFFFLSLFLFFFIISNSLSQLKCFRVVAAGRKKYNNVQKYISRRGSTSFYRWSNVVNPEGQVFFFCSFSSFSLVFFYLFFSLFLFFLPSFLLILDAYVQTQKILDNLLLPCSHFSTLSFANFVKSKTAKKLS